MTDMEYGSCEICSEDGALERTYFRIPIACGCHGPEHFDLIRHCENCEPKRPATRIELSSEQAEKLEQDMVELAEYRKLKAEGRHIELPCKVGDTVYAVWQTGFILEWRIHHIQIQLNGRTNSPHIRYWGTCENHELDDMDFWGDDFGKTIFLTREDVKAKLQESIK